MTVHFSQISLFFSHDSRAQKRIRFTSTRPKTAPTNVKASVSSVTSSTLRAKKNSSNQVSPLVDSNFPKRFNYDVACERGIHDFRTGIIGGVLTVSEITGKAAYNGIPYSNWREIKREKKLVMSEEICSFAKPPRYAAYSANLLTFIDFSWVYFPYRKVLCP